MKSTLYHILFAIALSLFLGGCQTKKEPILAEELYTLMQGSFNSEAQAKQDSTYFNISLHMYPIWKEKGYWLYVEQALNARQDKPYRQRIYEVKQLNDSVVSSTIYTLPNDSLYIGKWKDPDFFNSIPIDSLQLRKGCDVYLSKTKNNTFTGATKPESCQSSLRGASYATSEVTVYKDKIISWDRGFDSEGKQVWGATKQGYIFLKINDN